MGSCCTNTRHNSTTSVQAQPYPPNLIRLENDQAKNPITMKYKKVTYMSTMNSWSRASLVLRIFGVWQKQKEEMWILIIQVVYIAFIENLVKDLKELTGEKDVQDSPTAVKRKFTVKSFADLNGYYGVNVVEKLNYSDARIGKDYAKCANKLERVNKKRESAFQPHPETKGVQIAKSKTIVLK